MLPATPWAVAVLLMLVAAGCAHRGYFLDEPSRRIYAKDSWGRVTKSYEPGTEEYNSIALRFYPQLVDKPAEQPEDSLGRRARLNAFMKGLDKDQWHILLDLELWTGDDKADLSHVEDLERVARSVKGMPFNDFLHLKERYPTRSELMARLLKGD